MINNRCRTIGHCQTGSIIASITHHFFATYLIQSDRRSPNTISCLNRRLRLGIRVINSGRSECVRDPIDSGVLTSMLCLDMRLVQRLRGERTEDAAARDRSKSVCVASFRSKSPRDVSAFKLFHRRASSAIVPGQIPIHQFSIGAPNNNTTTLQQPENDGQEHCRRFRIENGDSPGEKDEMFGSPSTPVLENPEYQTRWYFKYFLGKLHQNYVGLDNDKIPFFLSIVLNEDNNSCVPLYRAILFRKTVSQM
ncbi:hypothetical protein GEV33_007155 [Tenebrio molitor]|uniref:Uncharacterized protein n=1 Tax=Tenebrio molitor TaxID=7067 RepID=A0A8J6HKC1_TENMO|nr:hypothetical protein GEV33_007155 [Tenebrio molitor]